MKATIRFIEGHPYLVLPSGMTFELAVNDDGGVSVYETLGKCLNCEEPVRLVPAAEYSETEVRIE